MPKLIKKPIENKSVYNVINILEKQLVKDYKNFLTVKLLPNIIKTIVKK